MDHMARACLCHRMVVGPEFVVQTCFCSRTAGPARYVNLYPDGDDLVCVNNVVYPICSFFGSFGREHAQICLQELDVESVAFNIWRVYVDHFMAVLQQCNCWDSSHEVGSLLSCISFISDRKSEAAAS